MKHVKYIFLLAGFSYFFFMFGNGVFNLTDPDEVFYAQTAMEMAGRHEWMTPYLFDGLNFEKPILIYWLIRIASLVFGDTAFAARFFPALFGIFGVLLVYLVGVIGFRDRKKAFVSAVILMSSGLYIGIARTVFTDMVFSVLILAALAAFLMAYLRQWRPGTWLFYILAGFAVLAKGPLGLVIPLLAAAAFSLFRRDTAYWKQRVHWGGASCFLLIAVPWYWAMIQQYGNVFIQEFFVNDHWVRLISAEHLRNDTWYFYPGIMIAAMFPWSVFVLAALVALYKRLSEGDKDFNLFLACWMAAVLVVFQFAHSKLASYILPLFPALALLAGSLVMDLWRRGAKLFWSLSWATGIIFLAVPCGLAWAGHKYAAFIPSRHLLFLVVGMFAVLAVVHLILVLRQKRGVLYVPAVFFGLVFVVLLLARPAVEDYFSTTTVSDSLKREPAPQGTILCSKFLARGVRYHTGARVAAMKIGGKQFFSPHPIPFFSDRAELSAFLRSQPQTYAVLDNRDLNVLVALALPGIKLEELSRAGNTSLVRIAPVSVE